MRVYIPDSYFINDAAHRYVTLFSQFGAQGGSYSASGGFEEWGVNSTSAGSGNTASFLMTKTALVADGGNADNAGDVINYTIKLSNVGNVALTGVTVTDPLLQGPNATLSGPSGDSNANAVLDVGEVWTYSGTYTVQQSDIDNFGQGDGSIDNTATADTAQTTAQSASASVLVELHPSIALVKAAVGHFTDLNENGMVDPGETKFFDDANFNGRVDAGETIDYDFTVMNDGNVTIQNINVSDLVGGVAVSGGPITLGPGQSDSSTFNGTYTVTQADIDAGFFDNTARATGTFTEGNDIELIHDEHVLLPQDSRLTIVKGGVWEDGNGDSFADPGELVHYTFAVTNDGNVTLSNLEVSDTLFIAPFSGPPASGDADSDGVFDVGETWVYSAGLHDHPGRHRCRQRPQRRDRDRRKARKGSRRAPATTTTPSCRRTRT